MSRKDAVIAYRDAIRSAGAIELRLPMTTDDAIALARELAPAELRHAEQAAAALATADALAQTPEPEEFDARVVHLNARAKAVADFWEAFEGQEVAGVEIIRRR